MDLLTPRSVYHRANSDDPQPHDGFEMVSVNSRYDDTKSTYLNHSVPSTKYAPVAISSVWDYGDDDHTHFTNQDQVPTLRPSTSTKWFSGWRTGAFSAAFLALISLAANILAAIWLKGHPNAESNLVEVFNGSCDAVSKMEIWAHLVINLISTLLLGGSNYCMQCLCAPTRPEIDKAHANGQFLDIAVPSYRNLRHIANSRRFMWWVLALSSIPLHLLYNSAFYSSLSANDYEIYLVTPDFLKGGNATARYKGPSLKGLQRQIATNQPHRFERLDPLACIQAYAQVLLADRRNLVFVLKNNTLVRNSTVIDYHYYEVANAIDLNGAYEPFNWICTSDPEMSTKVTVPDLGTSNDPPCDLYVDQIEAIANQWNPWGHPIQYCLSEVIEEHCSFNGNLPIIYVVIAANAIKLFMMLIVACHLAGNPLITIGDAVESFLDTPDQTTKDVCYLTRDQVIEYVRLCRAKPLKPVEWKGVKEMDNKAQVKKLKTFRWSEAASTRRWTLTIGFTILAVITVIGFLGAAIDTLGDTGSTIQDLGFGTIHVSAVIYGWLLDRIEDPSLQILAAILVANLPQAILSFLYLSLNGLLTSMFTALEWSKFATERKALRVSTPKGQQRSTHFLQLPYKIALPLMTVSGVLHWLVSQSIFLAVVASYGSVDGELINPTQIASCGFSPIAMMIVIGFGVFITVACFVIGRFKYDPSMPLVGSCSVAISAACHRPDWDVDAGTSHVQWGVIPHSYDATGVGHCTFTSGPIEPVQAGKEYAGMGHRR